MCNTCGCNIRGKFTKTESNKQVVTVLQDLLQDNDHQAAHNRHHFSSHQVLAINLMSSPGAGKTTLLETTIDALKDEFSIAVIEGDLETENDANRIRAKGIPAIQISTGSACHLDAHMVHNALHQLDLTSLDIVFIENVGNLVCPASFDLGQHLNVALLSCTEGDDKPAKYPVMFRVIDLMLISKMDLLPMLDDFEPHRAEQYLRHLANDAPVLHVAARKQTKLDSWFDWLRMQIVQYQQHIDAVSHTAEHMRHHEHELSR